MLVAAFGGLRDGVRTVFNGRGECGARVRDGQRDVAYAIAVQGDVLSDRTVGAERARQHET